jgi:ADP-dependent glucokinase
MANRAAKLGARVLLGGPVGTALRSLLHADVKTATDVNADAECSTQRVSAHDEYHLILEYAAQATFGDARAPRANRFILHSDENNGRVSSLEPFHAALRRFRPDTVAIAGLHLLQEQAASVRSERVREVRKRLCTVPHAVALHFEFGAAQQIGDILL